MSLKTKMIRFIRHWHARIGVLAALFFLFLAISGVALNHTDALNLDKQAVSTNWLMRWYGLKATMPNTGYLFKDGYFAAAEGRWVMDDKTLQQHNQQPVIGAIAWGEMRAIACAESLYLYTLEGQLVDKLSGDALPNKTIQRLGLVENALAIATAQGDYVSYDGLAWSPLESKASKQPEWSKSQALPKVITTQLVKKFAPALPLERIILDVHSGRILGRYGVLLMDLAALVLTLLSLSGVWIYWRAVRRK